MANVSGSRWRLAGNATLQKGSRSSNICRTTDADERDFEPLRKNLRASRLGGAVNVGVVIPVYNRPVFVEEAIESVLKQSAPVRQIVVVDDGSSVGNLERLRSYVDRISSTAPVELITQANKGAAAARNLGMSHLSAEIDVIAFLDSDDLWPEDFTFRIGESFKLDPELVAVSSDGLSWDVANGVYRDMHLDEFAREPWFYVMQRGAGIASCSAFRLSAVREVGGFPEGIKTGHDACLYGALLGKGAWSHMKGLPVVFRRNFEGAHPEEATHLFRAFRDYAVQWAKAIEAFASHAPEGVRAELRGQLAKRWLDAALQEARQKRYRSGVQCLSKAVLHSPTGTVRDVMSRTIWKLERGWRSREPERSGPKGEVG